MGVLSGLRSMFGAGRAPARQADVPQEGFVPSECVAIGTQVWMSRNLDVGTFRNGEPIPEARTPEEWIEAGKNGRPAWCHYQNNPEHGAVYGRLYNWFAVADPRGLAPRGWHVPTDPEYTQRPETKEFTRLIVALGGTHYAGSKLKERGTAHWRAPNNNPADNASGFTALPAGSREPSGNFSSLSWGTSFWSATPNGTEHAHMLSLQNDSGGVVQQYTSKMAGKSVRLLKD